MHRYGGPFNGTKVCSHLQRRLHSNMRDDRIIEKVMLLFEGLRRTCKNESLVNAEEHLDECLGMLEGIVQEYPELRTHPSWVGAVAEYVT